MYVGVLAVFGSVNGDSKRNTAIGMDIHGTIPSGLYGMRVKQATVIPPIRGIIAIGCLYGKNRDIIHAIQNEPYIIAPT